MQRLRSIISSLAFGLLALVLLTAPWFFGAWEAWWFWPFTGLLFLSSALFGAQLMLESIFPEPRTVSGAVSHGSRRRVSSYGPRSPWMIAANLSYLLFLGYAALRFMQAPVFVDAQRSFLLFLTPFLVAMHVVYGLDRAQRRLLFNLMLFDLLLLGLYGIINHALCGSRYVLWRPGFPQYTRASRASGSYFCPDHYAGIMEMAFCLAMAQLCMRGTRWSLRIASILISTVAVLGILLSKSRGAGLALVVVTAGIWVWGLRAWPTRRRWIMRAALPLLAVLLMAGAAITHEDYFRRFNSWFGLDRAREQPLSQAVNTVAQSIQRSSRWMMLSGAMRAWKMAPVLGIGPGMHQNVWPHVAASPDGDIEKKIWPSRLNNTHYSYEVHNDWAQLLEEYGLLGFTLFLLPVIAVSGLLLMGLRRAFSSPGPARSSGQMTASEPAMALAAWLSMLAIAFHSLGDFNLQMPATNWLFAAIIGLGARSAISRALVQASATSPHTPPGEKE